MSTGVMPLSQLAHEKGITTLIHNHPHFGNHAYGGTFSKVDVTVAVKNYVATKGVVNTIKATAKEGTYIAVVTKNIYRKGVNKYKIARAASRAAKNAWDGKTFSTKKANKKKLVTQKIGEV